MVERVFSLPAAEAYRRRAQREQIVAIRRRLRTLDRLAVVIREHTMEIHRRLSMLEHGHVQVQEPPDADPTEADLIEALAELEADADGAA